MKGTEAQKATDVAEIIPGQEGPRIHFLGLSLPIESLIWLDQGKERDCL